MNNIIILLGQRVRSGTNFIGSTLSQHPDVTTIPADTSLGEFNILRDRRCITDHFQKMFNQSFGLNYTTDIEDTILKKYGELWLSYFISQYNIQKGQTIFLKTCIIYNADLWQKIFPEAKIAVIYRDGRDNVISSIKGSNDRRNWHKMVTRLKKRINYISGRSFINHTKDWSRTARELVRINEAIQIKAFKYEDLNDNANGIKSLLEYYGLKSSPEIIEHCKNAPVMGSSFGIQNKKISKPNWSPQKDKSKFVFSGKWKHWGIIKKALFKQIAGKELLALNYEKNKSW